MRNSGQDWLFSVLNKGLIRNLEKVRKFYFQIQKDISVFSRAGKRNLHVWSWRRVNFKKGINERTQSYLHALATKPSKEQRFPAFLNQEGCFECFQKKYEVRKNQSRARDI